MAADLPVLVTLLENDARYDADVVAGRNGAVLALLNESEVGSPVAWKASVPVADIKSEMVGVVLTAENIDKLNFYFTDLEFLDFRLGRHRNLVFNSLGGNQPATDRITTIAQVAEQTYAQVAGVVPAGENVRLVEVRLAVRQVAKSFIVSSGQDGSA